MCTEVSSLNVFNDDEGVLHTHSYIHIYGYIYIYIYICFTVQYIGFMAPKMFYVAPSVYLIEVSGAQISRTLPGLEYRQI